MLRLKLSKVWLMLPQRQQQLRRPLLKGRTICILFFLSSLNIVAHRVKKRKKAEPTPRNAFPHVVEKVCIISTVFEYYLTLTSS